jgi:hypothetical protein
MFLLYGKTLFSEFAWVGVHLFPLFDEITWKLTTRGLGLNPHKEAFKIMMRRSRGPRLGSFHTSSTAYTNLTPSRTAEEY